MTRPILVPRSGLALALAVVGLAVNLPSCGASSTSTDAQPTNTMATPDPVTVAPPVHQNPNAPPATASPSEPASSATSDVTSSVLPNPSPTPTTSPNSTSEPEPTGDSGLDDSSTGDSGSGASSAPVDSSTATTEPPVAADDDPKPEDFTCIADWEQVSGFRIHNFLGHLDEAKAVANNPVGGVYPVGTILQAVPSHAMVKRHAGFSPETNDWEFFLLSFKPDGTTHIAQRGPDLTPLSGLACVVCHGRVAQAYDFVCNTWADHTEQSCGPDVSQTMLDEELRADTRCQ